MDDYELLLCQNENKRLRGIIERLEDKVRDSSTSNPQLRA